MPSRGRVSLIACLSLQQLGGAVVVSPNGDSDVSPDVWPKPGGANLNPYTRARPPQAPVDGGDSAGPKPYPPWSHVEFEWNGCDPEEFQQKPFDVAIFGATGRMGRAVLSEFKALGEEMPRLVTVGHHMDADAATIEATLGLGAEGSATVEVGGMDLVRDADKLVAVTNKTRMVLNFAGPYERNGGENLVRAALKGCAHYVDLSTETKWKRRIYDQYHMKAAQRKMAIVQAAGFNAVAADLLALSAAEDLVSLSSEMPTHVAVAWEVMNNVIEPKKQLTEQGAYFRHGPTADPYILAPEVPFEMRVDKTVDGHTGDNMGINPMFDDQSLVQYIPSKLECPIIRRSLHTQYPHNAISVQEVCTSAMVARLGAFRRSVPLQEGEVSARTMAMGTFMGKGTAMLRPNATEGVQKVLWTRVMLEGRGDPNYVATPKIAVQIALGLLYEGPQRFGYLTPTMALGTKNLEERLTSVDGGNFLRVRHGV